MPNGKCIDISDIKTWADLDDAISFPSVHGLDKHFVLGKLTGGSSCNNCRSDVDLCLDHILADARGGTYNIWNTMVLCNSCNVRKHTYSAEELAEQGEFRLAAAIEAAVALRGDSGEAPLLSLPHALSDETFKNLVAYRIAGYAYFSKRVEFGTFLLKKRQAQRISVDIARAFMKSGYDTIGRWERGIHVPSFPNLERYLDMLEVGFDEVSELYTAVKTFKKTTRVKFCQLAKDFSLNRSHDDYYTHRCSVCRYFKNEDEFYKDASRRNGLSSRCKDCERERDRSRTDPTRQSFVGSAEALNAPRTKVDNSYAYRQLKKRTDEILSEISSTPVLEREIADTSLTATLQRREGYRKTLAEIRLQKGFSLWQMTLKMGCSNGTELSRFERGLVELPPSTFKAYCEVLDVCPESLTEYAAVHEPHLTDKAPEKQQNRGSTVAINDDLSNCRTELGKAIRLARIRSGWSQREFAQEMGCSTNYIVSLEIGIRHPNPVNAYRFKNRFDLPESVMPAIDFSQCQTEIGKQIKEHRVKKGMLCKEAAKQIGVSKGTYSHWERCVIPSSEYHQKIIEVLGVPPDIFHEHQETVAVKLEAGLGTLEVKASQTVAEMRDAGLTIDAIAEIKGMERVEVFQQLSACPDPNGG